MKLCLPFLASLVLTPNMASCLSINPNISLPLSSLAYSCASPIKPIDGRQTPAALDCLNVLTFILVTTPNHNRPAKWSQLPGPDRMMLPYRRNSGSCQLLVRISADAPPSAMETASVDHVVGAAMRLIEVCLLYGEPDVEQIGGFALAGLNEYLDVVIWGAPNSDGNEGASSDGTLTLTGPGALLTEVLQA